MIYGQAKHLLLQDTENEKQRDLCMGHDLVLTSAPGLRLLKDTDIIAQY